MTTAMIETKSNAAIQERWVLTDGLSFLVRVSRSGPNAWYWSVTAEDHPFRHAGKHSWHRPEAAFEVAGSYLEKHFGAVDWA